MKMIMKMMKSSNEIREVMKKMKAIIMKMKEEKKPMKMKIVILIMKMIMVKWK